MTPVLRVRWVLLCLLLAGSLSVACGSTSSGNTSGRANPSVAPAAATRLSAASATVPSGVSATPVGDGSTASGAGNHASTLKLSGQVTVFAAASLTESFQQMGRMIEQANPGAKLIFNFAGSPTLRTQLAQGAKADVFASADEPNMQGAQKDGSIVGQPRIFVQNKLVVITPAKKNAVTQLQDLAKPGIKLILAQPAVPVGNYSRQALSKLSQDPAYGPDFSSKALANVVSNEQNVKDVVTKVQLGEADAGIVYTTDAAVAGNQVKEIAIPDQYNIIASYPIAEVKGAPNNAGARAFIAYVLSPAGQSVLKQHGFLPPSGP